MTTNPFRNPLVSIRLMTYNQEDYISQAIESALAQRTNFNYEIVIGDDFSTDKTPKIAKSYEKQYPGRIKVLYRDRHLGRLNNFSNILRNCTGKYIALLDGDDYWTDPHKLQKQVDFLESHPECAICFHNVQKLYQDQQCKPHPYCSPQQKKISTLEDLLIHNFIPTCSTMFRRGLFKELPPWVYQVAMGDRALHILNAQYGSIGYLDEIMGVYRVHKGSVWSSKDMPIQVKDGLVFYQYLADYLGPKYHSTLLKGVRMRLGWLMPHYLDLYLIRNSNFNAIKTEIAQIFNHWPKQLTGKTEQLNQFYKELYTAIFFKSYKNGNLPLTRYALRQIIYYNPALLQNLGVWSIAVEAVVGKTTAANIRKTVRRANPKNLFIR